MRVESIASTLVSLSTDLLVVLVPEGAVADSIAALDGADGFQGALGRLVTAEEYTGKASAAIHLPTLGRAGAPWISLVGLGKNSTGELRNAAGVAGRFARGKGVRSVAFVVPGNSLDASGQRALLEGVSEGNYLFDRYKPAASRKAALESVSIVGVTLDAEAVRRATATAVGQSLTRDLVNDQPAEVYPESLAAVAAGLAGGDLTVTVLDEHAIKAKGMGGITGVGQGSTRPPRFVHMSWNPAGATHHIALVGKGVTFDSGGLSLKPSDGMLTMRCDMAGAAAVIGAMKAVTAIQPKVRVDAIFGAVENMPSGNAYKLGDILRMYNGKTVEIHNTDAEGRLVLADCLSYASELKPEAVVDLATLTGAAVVALGDWYTALYARTDGFANTLLGHAGEAGDAVWRMPLVDLYKDKIKAEWGEIKNTGGRPAGSITAALFLAEFVTVENWAHLDIAGPAFLDSGLMHLPPGGTGTMVRTLVRWIESLEG